jgi:hypothetical protein
VTYTRHIDTIDFPDDEHEAAQNRLGSSFLACILDSHLHRVTYARRIDTIDSPDDEHEVAQRCRVNEINI